MKYKEWLKWRKEYFKMADFCWDCAWEHLGVDSELNDMKNLCKEDENAWVLCEGCGEILVDNKGKRVKKK